MGDAVLESPWLGFLNSLIGSLSNLTLGVSTVSACTLPSIRISPLLPASVGGIGSVG